MSVVEGRIVLVKPEPHHKQAMLEYREEFRQAKETLHGSGSFDHASSYEAWLQTCIDSESQATVPKGKVPATQFLAIRSSDGKLIGTIQVRHSLNEQLKLSGGHIGYSVRKSERSKGYATQMLKAALDFCQTLELQQVLLTCDPSNVGSSKVIKANGGIYRRQVVLDDGSKLDHYWIT